MAKDPLLCYNQGVQAYGGTGRFLVGAVASQSNKEIVGKTPSIIGTQRPACMPEQLRHNDGGCFAVSEALIVWTCRKCGEEKPFEDFPRDKYAKYGRMRLCKTCVAIREKERYWSNPEKERERSRVKDRNRKRVRKTREKNPEYHERLARRHKLEKTTPQGLARIRLYWAIRGGRVVKPTSCQECGAPVGKERLQGHHHDYSKPLDVEWLCIACHWKKHSRCSIS